MDRAQAVPVVKGAALTAEVPWSEKYRPQSLDEVAAHKDIIDTSERGAGAQRGEASLPESAAPPACWPAVAHCKCAVRYPTLPHAAPPRSQEAAAREPAAPPAFLRPTGHGQDVDHPGHRAPNLRQVDEQHDPGAQRLRRPWHQHCAQRNPGLCLHAYHLQVRAGVCA